MMTPDEQIGWFFAPPYPEQEGLERSSLHQNRREIQDAFIRKAIPEDQVLPLGPDERHALFATCMVIGSGIDLLAKFYAGSDSTAPGGVTNRFLNFLERFMFSGFQDSRDLARIVYEGVRNPIVHSFTLHSKRRRVKLVSRIVELESKAVWRFKSKPTEYLVSVEGLFTDYVKALNAYQAELWGSPDLRAKFAGMLPDYGYIRMSDKPIDLTDLE
jgi:hypothetical protein